MTQPIPQLLRRLWHHISPRRRVGAAPPQRLPHRPEAGLLQQHPVESAPCGSGALAAIAILTDPARVFAHPSAQSIIQTMGLTEPKQLLLPLTIAFGLAALIAGAMRLLLLWASPRLSYAAGADLSISIYRHTLYQPYEVHVACNV